MSSSSGTLFSESLLKELQQLDQKIADVQDRGKETDHHLQTTEEKLLEIAAAEEELQKSRGIAEKELAQLRAKAQRWEQDVVNLVSYVPRCIDAYN